MLKVDILPWDRLKRNKKKNKKKVEGNIICHFWLVLVGLAGNSSFLYDLASLGYYNKVSKLGGLNNKKVLSYTSGS